MPAISLSNLPTWKYKPRHCVLWDIHKIYTSSQNRARMSLEMQEPYSLPDTHHATPCCSFKHNLAASLQLSCNKILVLVCLCLFSVLLSRFLAEGTCLIQTMCLWPFGYVLSCQNDQHLKGRKQQDKCVKSLPLLQTVRIPVTTVPLMVCNISTVWCVQGDMNIALISHYYSLFSDLKKAQS